MNKSRKMIVTLTGAMLILSLILTGCGAKESSNKNPTSFEIPGTLPTVITPEINYDDKGHFIDVSTADKGYVTVSTISDNPDIRLQVKRGDWGCVYQLTKGEVMTVPVNMDNGEYIFAIMEQTTPSKFVNSRQEKVEVNLENAFTPYLIPTVFCEYEDTDKCVQLAKTLGSDEEKVEKVYDYVINNISYDNKKASEIAGKTGWYVPNPDETLETKKGICFDYSSLIAAMLRSSGVPCKIATGYVDLADVYHAWNEIYIDGEWKMVHLDLKSGEWGVVDSTFGAGNKSYVAKSSDYHSDHQY